MAEITLKIKKLRPDVKIPNYAYEGDAGLDLYSTSEYVLEPGKSCLVRTGIIIELPKDTEAQIRPRSGLALKNQITVLNSPGTIDFGYRGEIGVILINHGRSTFKIEKNMKIAQMVVKPIVHVKIEESEMLNPSERDKSGFGSTGTIGD